ncbi:MAG TPA: heparan-alpha-glucosaminide N-acetyltransferase domain-containing protein [Candidatus Binatia bacterium]|nr:heparan-alpha-glucosaminide N-acetyltransferase domain-containing protein [Candidatus Binatia bacterium]
MIAVGRHAGALWPDALRRHRATRGIVRGRDTAAAAAARRVGAVDACRGVAVLGMLLANLVNVFFHEVPPPLAHNQGDTLRLFDFPAPIFQFLVGVSLVLFLRNRMHAGRSRAEARRDALGRFVRLIGLGMVLDGIGALSIVPRWGVLQTLGLGGIVATLLDAAPTEGTTGLGVALLGIFSGPGNGIVHGSPPAALAFVPLTLAGAFAGEVLVATDSAARLARRACALAAIALAAACMLFAAGVPFNKMTGTSSFVALAVAVAAALLAAVAAAENAGVGFPAWLLAVGRNALTAWVLLHVLVYYPAWLVFPSWERLGALPGMLAALLTTAALAAFTIALARRGLRVAL